MTFIYEQQSQEQEIVGANKKIPKTLAPKATQAVGGPMEAVLKPRAV